MGAVHKQDEDARARELMRDMPEEVRAWIGHHFGNSLCVVLGNIEHILTDPAALRLSKKNLVLLKNAREAARHTAADLDVIRRSRQEPTGTD